MNLKQSELKKSKQSNKRISYNQSILDKKYLNTQIAINATIDALRKSCSLLSSDIYQERLECVLSFFSSWYKQKFIYENYTNITCKNTIRHTSYPSKTPPSLKSLTCMGDWLIQPNGHSVTLNCNEKDYEMSCETWFWMGECTHELLQITRNFSVGFIEFFFPSVYQYYLSGDNSFYKDIIEKIFFDDICKPGLWIKRNHPNNNGFLGFIGDMLIEDFITLIDPKILNYYPEIKFINF